MINKKEIIEIINNELQNSKTNFIVDSKTLDTLVLDITRVVDSKITISINNLKKEKKIKISSVEKEELRKYILGYPLENEVFDKKNIDCSFNKNDLNEAYILFNEGLKRNRTTMINSLIGRIKKNFLNNSQELKNTYLDYINELQKNKHELIILKIDNNSLSVNNIAEIIEKNYSDLSNYHHMIIIFSSDKATVNWTDISYTAIYMENFKSETNFSLFNKNNKSRRIEELIEFLQNHPLISYNNLDNIIKNYYEGVSYGFHFKDLFITEDGLNQILVMQKIELDNTPKKCPECNEESVRGNSYPKVLYKSFECSNPSCPARSKIGRGKRYDLLAAKRQLLLERNLSEDKIDNKTYTNMRRDIIKNSESLIERLISLYCWAGDSVLLINIEFSKDIFKKRKITKTNHLKFDNKNRIKEIPIYKLFLQISKNIVFSNKNTKYNIIQIGKSTIIEGNSSYILPFVKKDFNFKKIGGAVTSPPYYNAREYSQWKNLLSYLIDMMINAKAVLTALDNNGIYIYNIGDVVDQDNIYIKSNMSKRRQILGFYSVFIFELIGFKTISNTIWDKGEVESKRNSTQNLFSGYVNPINSYEHCFFFSKNKESTIIPTIVKKINAVKKINSKGENILGHTAPFPEEIPNLILPFIEKDAIVVDPYLGSGTSCISMANNSIHSLGFEMNKEYFKLAIDRIGKTTNK